MSLTGIEFMRRFLQHVLPKGFRRVRVYGWLSPAAHKRLARIQALLDWKPEPPLQETREILCRNCEGGSRLDRTLAPRSSTSLLLAGCDPDRFLMNHEHSVFQTSDVRRKPGNSIENAPALDHCVPAQPISFL